MVVIPKSREVLFLRFFSQANRTPEIQVIVRFLEELAPGGEKRRVRRYHDAVHPGREKKQKCETNVSREKGLKDPERVRFKYVSENGEGRNKASCDVGISICVNVKKNVYLLQGKVSGQAPAGLYMMCFVEVRLGSVSHAPILDAIQPLTSKGAWQTPNSTTPSLGGTKPSGCSHNI